MRTGGVTVLAAALGILVSAPAGAQQTPSQNTILEVHRSQAKPGMRAQLEAGRMKHMAWHKAQGDKWAWHVWEVLTGPDTGSYIITSPGHQWADFDAWGAKMGKGDRADAEANIGPHQASSMMQYWVMLADATRLAAGAPVPPMGALTTYRVKSGKVDQFRQALRIIKDGLDKAEFERRVSWYMLVSGGPTRTFAVFAPRASMADMALPQVSMIEALEKAIGRGPANAAVDSFNDAIESGETELLEFRQDLSYLPQPTS